jgi:integrase
MAKNVTDTSISDTDARTFIKDGKDRAIKTCTKIAGFHLIKIGEAGSWRYRYSDILGKRRAVTIGNYPSMKAAEAAQLAMRWRNQKVDPLAEISQRKASALSDVRLSESRSLGAYLDGIYTKHQARKKHAGVHTLQMIRGNFTALLDRDMTSISADDVKTWQLKREQDGVAYATLQRAFGALKTLLRHAEKEKIIDKNPIAGEQLYDQRADEKSATFSEDAIQHRRMLTSVELASLYRGLTLFAEELRAQRRSSRKHGRVYLPDLDLVTYPHWFIPFFGLALHTGLRPGDLYTLTWHELNLSFKRLVKVPGKTMHHRDPAKLDLHLTDDCLAIMAAWHQQIGKPKDGLVFPSTVEREVSESAEAPRTFSKKAHGKAWVRVRALGGVDPALHFYSLRHHFISALVAGGAPLLAVAKLVGHKSTKMIEEHYGHLAPNTAADLMRSLSESLTLPPEINPSKQVTTVLVAAIK